MSAQCASLDPGPDLKLIFKHEGIGCFLRLAIHASRDKGRARFGLSPHHIGIVGKPGATALITTPGALEEYTRLLGPKFRNEVCARVMLTPHEKPPPMS